MGKNKNFSITILDNQKKSDWDQIVESASSTVFHSSFWLQAAAEETKTDLKKVICYYRNEIFFVIPLFIKKFLGLKFIFSPPPKCLIPYLGFIFSNHKLKINQFEYRYFNAIDLFLQYIYSQFNPDYLHIINPVGVTDLRPFIWYNYKILPKYTYFINLAQGENDIFKNIKAQARTDIRRAQKYHDLKISENGKKSLIDLVRLVRRRYKIQKLNSSGSDNYFNELYFHLNQEKKISIKTINEGDNLLTGLVLLKHKNFIQHWIGGIVPQKKYIGLNEYLHWQVIKENCNGKFAWYDLVGANTRHLIQSKSKLNPNLMLYFQIEKGNKKGTIIKYIYDNLFLKNKSNRNKNIKF